MIDPSEIVQPGWDAIAGRYLEWSLECDWEPRRRYLELLMGALPEGSSVLEIGCGAGLPATRELGRRFRVTAIDVSPVQVGLARRNVPQADVRIADALTVELPTASFDGVAAFYSLTHVARERHAELYGRIAFWLRPGGAFAGSLAAGDDPGSVEEDWFGARMFFSGFDADTNCRLLREAGFELVRAEVLGQEEFGEEVRFLWVLARRV